MFLRFSNVEQLGACGASMSVLNIILYNGVDNMFEYVDENPVLRVTIYDKTTTYLNCTIIYWYKVVFLPGIIKSSLYIKLAEGKLQTVTCERQLVTLPVRMLRGVAVA